MMQRTLWLTALVSLLLLSQTAAAAESGVLNSVADNFLEASSKWADTISGYATWLFWTLATISLVWTFGFMALRKADIGEFFAEFIRFSLFTGFYLWLLRNGTGFAMDIIDSMRSIGAEAGGLKKLNPSTPIDIAFDILRQSFKSLSRWAPIDSLAIILVSLITLVSLATVAANVLLSLVSAWIMAYAGIFVLGFGGSRWTSEIALGYFRTVAGIALKLMTMTLMVGIALSVVDKNLEQIKNGADINQLLTICVVSLVLALLIHSVPNLIAGLIPGGGGAAGAVGSFSAGAVAGAAIGAGSTAASVVSSVASGGASLAANLGGGAQSMYSAFKSAQSNVGAGVDIASRMTGTIGGGGGGGGGGGMGGGGGSSPLGSVMGLVSATSGGMGGGSASPVTAMSSASGQASNGDSGGSNGAAGGASDSGAGSMAQSVDAGGGGSSSDARGASADQVVADGGGQAGGGSGGSSLSKIGTAGRIAMDMGANLVSGMGRMAQSRIGQTMGGKLAAEISNPGASKQSAGLNTTSSSRNFDPASEVAAYRDSKQENN
ncbi:P-type conjugative transfer protein TrbL [Pseudomonas sp. KHPS1]|nr:P-type conjugative transfer protein TrbL [Pseudomonas sp. KHPS1]UTH36159.1 P-type conjugative transfer protein TrbL [Pseudomonas sp. KHPS1]